MTDHMVQTLADATAPELVTELPGPEARRVIEQDLAVTSPSMPRVYPLVPRLRASALMSAFLDGVNVAAIGLMLAVTWQLARSAVLDWPSAGVALMATVLLLRWRINSVWLIAGGAAFGAIAHGLGR